MWDITIVIPTFNGAKRLPDLLTRLRSQFNPDNLVWEVIVIDNNSTDETAQIIQDYQNNWSGNCVLRSCQELEQGTAFARWRGVREAKADLIGFLDDDNLPSLNWVTAAYNFAANHPHAGAYASRVHADYQAQIPPNFDKIAGFFGITEKGDQPFIYDPKLKLLPPGLGLVIRKKAWLENVLERPFLTGPVGSSRLASEDLEAILSIQKGGWEIWYNPAMETYHQIPAHRLEKDYLLRVMKNTGLVRYHIRRLRWHPWQELAGFPLSLIKDLGSLINHFIKYHQVLKTDIIIACQMEFLLYSFFSPFYIYWLTIRKNIR